ncbi:hypothetical protein QL285_079835 [Trifolium repens]|nr:hypothetical protein QL285_079835 [Trifolium repens]
MQSLRKILKSSYGRWANSSDEPTESSRSIVAPSGDWRRVIRRYSLVVVGRIINFWATAQEHESSLSEGSFAPSDRAQNLILCFRVLHEIT